MFHLMVPWRDRTRQVASARPLGLLRNEFDVLMNRFMEDWLPPTGEFWKAAWSLDVEETDKEVVYRAELPGFEPAEIDVSLTGDVLTIRAEHHVEPKGTAPDTPTERRRVERSVVLPEGVDPDKMTATYRNGILELRLPRVPEAAPRRIEVKT